MAENEPKRCAACKTAISDYTPEYIKQVTTKYGNNKDCQLFLKELKINFQLPHDVCLKCQSLKWQNASHNQVKRPALSSDTTRKSSSINKDIPRKSSFHNNGGILIPFIFIVLVFLLGNYTNSYWTSIEFTKAGGVSDDSLKSTLKSLQEKFPPLQTSLKKKLSGALSRLQTPGEPIVLMLLHDDTNKKSTDCLASYASASAKQFIFIKTQQGLWMDGSEWTRYSVPNNDDLLLEKLNLNRFVENEVLVVENLQDLPWSLAKSLHHLCDAENPTYAKAMFVLELKVNGDTQKLNESQKLVAAEEAMDLAWWDAPREFRQPLITRLTSYVDTVAVPWSSDMECIDESFIRILP